MKSTDRVMVLVILLLVGTALVWYMRPRYDVAAPSQVAVNPIALGTTECPHYWGAHQGGPLPGDSLALAGAQTDQPEYNDCQRFIVNAKYDSIQAIFTRFHLDSAYRNPPRLGVPRASGDGDFGDIALPAIGITGLILTDQSANVPPGVHVMVIGEVYSKGDYAGLGIVKGYDSIVLAWDSRTKPIRQAAWMVSVGQQDSQCTRDPLSFSKASAVPLNVASLPTLADATGQDAVPPVSRWDWDDVAKVYYIGIMCPTSWCEISKDAHYHASASYAAPSDLKGADRRVVRQKGWYDEQYLAKTISVGPPVLLSPDTVMGTVFPDPALSHRKMSDYNGGRWQTAAWVSLDKESIAYQSKYTYDRALASSSPFGKRNRIDLCFKRRPQDCMPTRSVSANLTLPLPLPTGCNPDATHGGGTWFARMTGVRGDEKVFCVAYRPSPDKSQPPGVVRWRWTLKDETVWISCPTGCCEANAIGF